MQAVQFDQYGDVNVLEVREIADPVPGQGEVLVRVHATAVNPGEIAIREGVFAERWPATFPSGEGSDFAGTITAFGGGVDGFAVGDEVLGWTNGRASHAELVVAPVDQVVAKPAGLSWEVAGSLYIGPLTGLAAVDAVAPQSGEIVVVSGAAGGVGSTAAQLAVATGATVIGLASEGNHEWLRSRGVVPVAHGEGVAERIRQAAGSAAVDALVDTFGQGYVDLAVELGVPLERIATVIDFAGAERLGVTATGSGEIGSQETIGRLAELVVDGTVEVPIAATYPLDEVRAAYTQLAERHTRGKIVLIP